METKYYFMTMNGIHINGYTQTAFTDDEDTLLNGYIEVENPPQDLLDNFIHYKFSEGEIVKMSDEEFKTLYPNYGVVLPTQEEVQNDFNIDTDFRLSCLELGIN